MLEHHNEYYGGVAWANEIAKRGYAVLVPDAFPFASRRVLSKDVPEEIYEVEIGKGIVRRSGSDVTVVAVSFMAHESQKAANELAKEEIGVDLIDLRTAKPIDGELILESVKKTGRLVIADIGWKTCGYGAEISALVSEFGFEYLKAPVKRVSLPDCPAPAPPLSV